MHRNCRRSAREMSARWRASSMLIDRELFLYSGGPRCFLISPETCECRHKSFHQHNRVTFTNVLAPQSRPVSMTQEPDYAIFCSSISSATRFPVPRSFGLKYSPV